MGPKVKNLLLSFAVLVGLSSPVRAAFSLLVSTIASPGANGGSTAAIDSTGADLLVVYVGDGFATATTLSDSKGNAWTKLTTYSQGGGADRATIYYSTGPTVGTNHTFTYAATTVYPVIIPTAWSGSAGTTAFDKSTGTSSGSTNALTIPSQTPAEDNELFVSGVTRNNNSSTTVNSSFGKIQERIFSAGVNYGSTFAYKIQTTGAAESPLWTWATTGETAGTIALFKAAGAAAVTSIVPFFGSFTSQAPSTGIVFSPWSE